MHFLYPLLIVCCTVLQSKFKDLVSHQNDEGVTPLSNDEMLVEVLGKTPGYFRGKGAGVKAPSSKGTK